MRETSKATMALIVGLGLTACSGLGRASSDYDARYPSNNAGGMSPYTRTAMAMGYSRYQAHGYIGDEINSTSPVDNNIASNRAYDRIYRALQSSTNLRQLYAATTAQHFVHPLLRQSVWNQVAIACEAGGYHKPVPGEVNYTGRLVASGIDDLGLYLEGSRYRTTALNGNQSTEYNRLPRYSIDYVRACLERNRDYYSQRSSSGRPGSRYDMSSVFAGRTDFLQPETVSTMIAQVLERNGATTLLAANGAQRWKEGCPDDLEVIRTTAAEYDNMVDRMNQAGLSNWSPLPSDMQSNIKAKMKTWFRTFKARIATRTDDEKLANIVNYVLMNRLCVRNDINARPTRALNANESEALHQAVMNRLDCSRDTTFCESRGSGSSTRRSIDDQTLHGIVVNECQRMNGVVVQRYNHQCGPSVLDMVTTLIPVSPSDANNTAICTTIRGHGGPGSTRELALMAVLERICQMPA